MTLPPNHMDDLYRVIWKILTDANCHLYRIGGIENHVHLLIDLHPSMALAILMRQVKGISSTWMKSDARFTEFTGWGEGYYAATISEEAKASVIRYIKHQKTHHGRYSFDDELAEEYNRIGWPIHKKELM